MRFEAKGKSNVSMSARRAAGRANMLATRWRMVAPKMETIWTKDDDCSLPFSRGSYSKRRGRVLVSEWRLGVKFEDRSFCPSGGQV
jgi:hypothetical protein